MAKSALRCVYVCHDHSSVQALVFVSYSLTNFQTNGLLK